MGAYRICKGECVMGLIRQCNRFCVWIGRCINQHEGECLGYVEPDDEDDVDEILDKITY